MPEENVELVRRTIDLFNAGEINRYLGGVDETSRWTGRTRSARQKGIYRGRQGEMKLWRSFLDAWDIVQWDPEEIIEVDDARVLS